MVQRCDTSMKQRLWTSAMKSSWEREMVRPSGTDE